MLMVLTAEIAADCAVVRQCKKVEKSNGGLSYCRVKACSQ